jgi:hypothetical protein
MGTITVTKTFTITEARYVTSKIAADLRQHYLFYGVPDSDSIPNFAEEAALLLRDGYLESVDYGLKRNGSVIFAIRYVARSDGSLVRDDSSGRIVPGLDLSGASWFSYLRKSRKFYLLPESDRHQIERNLPVQRTISSEPDFSLGYWVEEKTYSTMGNGVVRSKFVKL